MRCNGCASNAAKMAPSMAFIPAQYRSPKPSSLLSRIRLCRFMNASNQLPTPLDVIAVGAHPDDVEIACGAHWQSW